MINLARFTQSIKAIVPIQKNSFQYNNKKYQVNDGIDEIDDNWYLVKIKNNDVKILKNNPDLHELDLKYPYKLTRGYTYNNSIIFKNFDIAKKKWNFEIQKPLHLNIAETFSSIFAIVWEDNNVYYHSHNYSDYLIYDVKACLDNSDDSKDNLNTINTIKGITPELRTLYLFHLLEKNRIAKENEALKQELKQELRQQEHNQLMKDTLYRLRYTFSNAGADIEDYSISGERIIINWSLPNQKYHYNSVINLNTWMVEEAGYCLSGGDKKLNITSLVRTADEFEKDGLTYITRY